MKKIIASALAGAALNEAARRAWQAKRQPRPRPPYRQAPPRSWAEARQRVAQHAGNAVKRELTDLAIRAGFPVPQRRPDHRTLFGPVAMAQIRTRRRDPWDWDD